MNRKCFEPTRNIAASWYDHERDASDTSQKSTRRAPEERRAVCLLYASRVAQRRLVLPAAAWIHIPYVHTTASDQRRFGYLRDMAKYPAGRCFVLGGHVAF
jgi:hypothetical protein